jgi:hypothetical protein
MGRRAGRTQRTLFILPDLPELARAQPGSGAAERPPASQQSRRRISRSSAQTMAPGDAASNEIMGATAGCWLLAAAAAAAGCCRCCLCCPALPCHCLLQPARSQPKKGRCTALPSLPTANCQLHAHRSRGDAHRSLRRAVAMPGYYTTTIPVAVSTATAEARVAPLDWPTTTTQRVSYPSDRGLAPCLRRFHLLPQLSSRSIPARPRLSECLLVLVQSVTARTGMNQALGFSPPLSADRRRALVCVGRPSTTVFRHT